MSRQLTICPFKVRKSYSPKHINNGCYKSFRGRQDIPVPGGISKEIRYDIHVWQSSWPASNGESAMLETWPAFQQATADFGWSGPVQFRKFEMCLDDNIREKFEECERDHYNAVANKTAANLGLFSVWATPLLFTMGCPT
jgi:hypothetical protein